MVSDIDTLQADLLGRIGAGEGGAIPGERRLNAIGAVLKRTGRAGWLALLLCGSSAAPARDSAQIIRIDASRPIATFRPDEAFGVAFDGGGTGESKPLLDPANRSTLTAAAVPRGSYRLRTELAIEAWHWSAFGRWSDATHRQGYWTGDPDVDDPAPVSHGYRLPRRGDTRDEANNDGYSRLDDGDRGSFWKSNPYLDARYTGVVGERRDWVKIDLGAVHPVDTAVVDWAMPFARRYRVQYWQGGDAYNGHWIDFPDGVVTAGMGGHAALRLAPRPLPVRYIRLLLEQSSRTAPPGATDPRDALGYAIREIGIGATSAAGRFVDLVRHAPDNQRQSLIYVSSTDPWHRAQDLDPHTEQPSPLAILDAGLIGRGPMMLPAGVLYDTPENAVAELAYFARRGVVLHQIELGEEPDGQRALPEDYGALYLETARLLHARWPMLALGGPSLVEGKADLWLEEGDQSFTRRFLRFLTTAGARRELSFFSFEYYPFDDLCGSATSRLTGGPRAMASLFRRLADDGVPADVPKVISEYGVSSQSGQPEVEMPSAAFGADLVADFLSRGGNAAYLYGFAPNATEEPRQPCAGPGNMMLWEADEADHARWPMPTFYGHQLLTREWVEPGHGLHKLFGAEEGGATIGVYPLLRPDGRWAVMLVNRTDGPASVRLAFANGGPVPGGPVERMTYADDRYRWSAALGHPLLDLPPRITHLAGWDMPLTLPPLSLTVLRDAPR